MNEQLPAVFLAALGAMPGQPKNLLSRVQLEADELGLRFGADDLLAHLESAGPNDPLRSELSLKLAAWDVAAPDSWTGSTSPSTQQRRAHVYALLGLPDKLARWLDDHYLVYQDQTIVITADDWTPWYTPERASAGEFYWRAYKAHLTTKAWPRDAINSLDRATTRIVERLADPTRAEAYQSKGLVVGYVQSGKTANFTGVIAKAVDAGYRHVIVLTGMVELLRGQTQRRIDMELVGRENMLQDRTLEDIADDPKFDYHDDGDWPDGFMALGVHPDAAGRPRLVRYTGRTRDYRDLEGQSASLIPVRRHPDRPLHDPDNLATAPAGLFIVKKNNTVLKKLIADLTNVKRSIRDIPVLLIDDESDQASPNTVDPDKVAKARTSGKPIKERTAINNSIAELLGLLPRVQYVGYTATPFANVLIDADDARNVFPRDFLIGLERPWGYMGASDFSDTLGQSVVDVDLDAPAPEGGNRWAHVRDIIANEEDEERGKLAEALDMFVLTGAVKLYRQDRDAALRFPHHTMLVHEGMKTALHADLADQLRSLWRRAGYALPQSLRRLESLYRRDVLPVSRERLEPDVPPAPPFDELSPYIGRAATRIIDFGGDPVLVVNSDQDVQRNQQNLDFDRGSVWRILVGGNKLSRGYTVEGLTVSYFRRATNLSDTLTQAGRWFGFRHGYRDLVRLYIGRREKMGNKVVDLYEAFEAIVRDEEAFRSQLKVYSAPGNGAQRITPIQVPPLVTQHLWWLRPAAKNKMFNAVLEEQSDPVFAPYAYPTAPNDRTHNLDSWLGVLEDVTGQVRLKNADRGGTFPALAATMETNAVVEVLRSLRWLPGFRANSVEPWLHYLERVRPVIENFVVILPQPSGAQREHVPGLGDRATVRRKRRARGQGNLLGEPSTQDHRSAAERLVGRRESLEEDLRSLATPSSAALLLYLVREEPIDPDQTVTVTFRIELPDTVRAVEGSPVARFRVRRTDRPNDAVIEKD